MKKRLTIIFCLTAFTAFAQIKLSPEEAINMALKYNYDIQVSRTEADISKTNNTAGNAGMLPVIQMSGSVNSGQNNVHQKLASGTVNDFSSQSTTTLNAGAELNWTLYDGGKMFVTKSKLSEIQSLGELHFMDKVLQTQFDVIAAYYDVVRQKQQLKQINELINYNRERVKITKTGFNAGYFVKTDLLQSQIDLNVALESAINQQFNVKSAQKNLNLLLGQDHSTVYEVSDTIPLNFIPDRAQLTEQLDIKNTTILLSQKQIDIAKLSLKEIKTGYLPKLNVKAGYYFSKSSNSVGSTLENQTYGPQIGGSVAVPLFSAGENKRKVAATKLDLLSAQYQMENVKLQIKTELDNALTDFENQHELLKIERENYTLARENLQISLSRLSHGETTSLEVHLAQESFTQSFTRLVNFEYNIKIAESKLKQLIAAF